MKANPLMIIAVLFAAAFAGRAFGLANAAVSREEPPAPASPSIAPPDALSEALMQPAPETTLAKADAPAPAIQPEQPVSASHRADQNASLIDAIRQRSAAIDAKETQLQDRARVLEAVEQRIDEKLAELRISHEELEKLVAYANEASEQDITLLARMYEQMKPQKAGEIFDKMNPAFAAGFLTEMNSESAALILTNMSTENAYEASMIIASRNAAVHQ